MPKNVQTTVQQILFSWLKNHWGWWLQPWNKPRQHIKKQRYHFADKGSSSQSYGFSSSHAWVWEWDHREGWEPRNWCFWTVVLEKTPESLLDSKPGSNQSILKEINQNCGVGEDSWEPHGLQGDPTSVLGVHWKDWCWSWNSNTLATWCEEPTHWKRPWCWEILRAGGEGDDRGWDGWMALSAQWTRVCANSRRWWRTGNPGVLQSMG